MKILIVGAGPTGLALAQQLAIQSHTVKVVERNKEEDMQKSHSGIGLRPNGRKVLRAWGLDEQVREVASESPGIGIRSKDGRLLSPGFDNQGNE